MQVSNSISAAAANLAANSAVLDKKLADSDAKFATLLAGAGSDATTWNSQLKELNKKVAGQVMGEMNQTPDSIASMKPTQRLAMQGKIMKQVDGRVQVIVRNQMEEKTGMNLSGAKFSTVPDAYDTPESLDIAV